MNENNGNKSKYEIDAKQIFDIIIKYWWITVISVALLIGVALGYSVITDSVTYTSSATLLINGGSEMTSYQQILAGQYQSKDYPYILTSRDTLENAAKILNESGELPDKDYTAAKLSKMISYKSEEDSRIFKISVTSDDPTEAMVVAKCVSTEFCERAEQLTKAEVGVVENPGKPAPVATANYKRNILLGAAVGAVVGIAISLFLGIGSDVLDSEEWILQKYKESAPLLASIPDSVSSGGRGYYKYRYKYKSYYNYSSKSSAAKKKGK